MNNRGDISFKDILTIFAIYILLIGVVSSSANITISQNSTVIPQNKTGEPVPEILENNTIINQTEIPLQNESQEIQESITLEENTTVQITQTEENISLQEENQSSDSQPTISQTSQEEPIIEIAQEKAVVGEPVIWSKKAYNIDENFTLEIPQGAIEINSTRNIKTIHEDGEPEPDIEIIYETPAPEMQEQEIANGKEIVVSSSEHYTNVLTRVKIDESLNLQNKEEVVINWIENNTRLYPKDIIDTNGNGIYDTVEFVVPHLSTQTFEIIVVNKAQHLDSSRNPISNIFAQVKELDKIYSENINDNEYVRVTFEKEINSQNDITIYPKIISGNPSIEIYQKNSNIKIAEFSTLFNLQENKVYLNSLVGSQNTFDLKIIGGVVQFDYIVDPSTTETADVDTVTFVAPTSGTEIDTGSFADTRVNDNTVFRVGYLDGAAQEPVDFEMALGFDLSSMGIQGSQIINISADISTCWTGGTGAACGTVDQPEFDQGTNGEFRVYLNGTSRSLMDCTSTECEATDELLLGDYNTNPTWGNAYDENLFQYQLTSGFDNSNIQNDVITLILKTNGTNYNVNYDVEHLVDYVSLEIWYNDHPTAPTQIQCNGGTCNFAVNEKVNLSCSGSTDSEGDEITYFINDSFGEIGNHTAGSNIVWNTSTNPERQITNFTCVAYDLSGSGVSSTEYFSQESLIIDNTAPVVNFSSGMITPGSTIAEDFIFINTTVNETNFENITFELYTSSGLLSQDSFTDSTRSINYTALSSQIYYYNVTVYDKANNIGYSTTENITLDSTAPSGSTSTPNTGTHSNSNSQNLTGTASDSIGLAKAILFIFNSTGSLINQTNISLTGLTATFGIIYSFAVDGVYKWFYRILDKAGNSYDTTNSTITIDTVEPTISPESIANNSADIDGNIIFQYNVTDPLSPIENCSLILNEINDDTDPSVANGTTESFSKNGLTLGRYNYSIQCFDESNNIGSSEVRFFDVISIEDFDGQTTNLESEDLSAVTNFILENQPYGKITYNGTIDITGVSNFDNLVSISKNNIFVNSTEEPKLNQSSTIEIFNLPYEFTPVILKDGQICSDCVLNSYSSGNLSFNATSFSSYTTTNNTKLILSDESESISKYSGDDIKFFANYTNLTSGIPVSGGSCNITYTDGEYQMSYNTTSFLFEYNRSFSAYGSKKYDVECFGTESLEDINATGYATIQYGSGVIPSSGYRTQSGTYDMTGTDEFIPLDYPIKDISRAFVIAPNQQNQENVTAAASGDPAAEPDDSFISLYLYNSTHIRAQRYSSVDGTFVITWQVLEALNEEFEVQRGEHNFVGSSATTTTDLSKNVSMDNSMTWFYLRTTLNDTNDGDGSKNDANFGNYIQFYSNLTDNDTIQFTRSSSAISTTIDFRWVVVEFNPDKISGLYKGFVSSSTGPNTSPDCSSIGTTINKTSSIMFHQSAASFGSNPDSDGGLDSSARAGYIQDDTTVCFYDYDGQFTAAIKWYIIDFGNTTGREENIHTDWATTDYIDTPTFTSSYQKNKTIFTVSGTSNGDGTAKPRHTQWSYLTGGETSTGLHIERTYGGQNREYAWQVLELPFYENLDSPKFFNPSVNETITSGKIRFNITVNDSTDNITWVKGVVNGIEENFTNLSGDVWYYDYTCSGDETVSFTYASAEDDGLVAAGNSTSITGINATCDKTNPQITFVSPDTPGNNAQSTNTYFDIDVSITETNFQKIIYELYNETDLINQTNFSTQVNSIRFSNLANGIYYYNVTVIDLANNKGSTGTRNIIFDNVAPQIDYAANMEPHGSFVSQTTIFQNVTIIEDNFKNVTFYLYDDLMSLERTPVTYTGSERSLTWTTLSDGLYFYQVETYDTLGNYNQTTLENITLDITSPIVSFGTDTKPDNFAHDRDYITVDAEYTETNFKNITFYLYNSTGLVDSTAYTDSTVEITWNSLPDGDYWYNVTVFDKVSNNGSTTTRKITLDSINPVVSYGLNTESDLAVLDQSNIFINVTVTETNFQNITFLLYDSLMQLVDSQTFTDSTRSYDFTNLASAEYNFRVNVLDSANNLGQTPIRTVYLDTLPPSVTITHPQATAYGYNESIYLNYTVVDQFSALDTCWWNIDDGANQTVSCTGSTTFDTDDGEHTIKFYANDTFGYLGQDSVTFLIATGGPAISLISPENDTYYPAATQVDFNYTATDLQFVDTCSLWGNWNGGWHLNQTDFNWLTGSISYYNESLETASPWNNWTNGGDGAGCVFTRSTSTPSGNTGPTGGYGPSPDGTSNFLFTEATSGQNCAFDDAGTHWATLESDMINASKYNISLSFWYHMYGAAMGNLYIDVNDSSGWHNNTFSIIGQQQTAETQNWLNQVVDFSSYSGMIRIRFRAVVGTAYTSDISIDHLNITLDSRENKPYGNFSVNLSQELNNYTWNIECNDTLGQTETALSNRTFAIDLTDPVVDFGSGTQSSGVRTANDYVYIDSIITEDNFKNITYYIYNSSSFSSYSYSFNKTNHTFMSLLSDLYDYNFTVFDKAGRSAGSSTRNITLDTVNPTGSLISPPDETFTKNQTHNFTASVSDLLELASARLFIYNSTGGLVNTTLINLAGLTAATIGVVYTFLYDDVFTWFYQVIDSVGNEYNTTSYEIEIDSTAPEITFIYPTEETDTIFNRNWILLNTSVYEKNYKNITFWLFDSSGLKYEDGFSSSLREINWTLLPDEDYTYNVTSWDLAGNEGYSETRTLTLDTTQPTVTFSGSTKPDGAVENSQSITAEVSVTEPNEANITFNLYNATGYNIRSNPYYDSRRIEIWTNMISTFGEGLYYYNVTVVDEVGLSGSSPTRAIILDATDPVVDFAAGTEDNYANKSQNYIYINASITEENYENITFYIYNSTDLVLSGFHNDSITYHNFTSLADGTYEYNFTVYDKASNSASSSTRTITLDATNPLIQFIPSTEDNDTIFNRNWAYMNVSITENNLQQIDFRIYDADSLYDQQIFTDGSHEYNFTSLPDNNYWYNVTATDFAGNTNSTETRKIGLDSVGPTVTIITPKSKTYGYNESLPLTHSATDSVSGLDTCWWNIDNGANQTITCNQATTFDTSSGSHTINFYANDTFGNLGYNTVSFYISLTGPAIELVRPKNDTFYSTATLINFSFSANDPDGVDTCSLWGDWGSGWHLNETYSGTWKDIGYKSRKNITIINGGLTALTDFPAYINVTYDHTESLDYNDIRFFNGSCEYDGAYLDFEIEDYDTSSGNFWVKIPSLEVGTNTICMYYKNSNADNNESGASVWSNSYTSVYHLDHTSGTALDTLGNFNAEDGITPDSNMDQVGAIGGADYFDGSDYLGTNPEWNVDGAHTYCTWVKFSSGHTGTILEDGGLTDGTGLGVTSSGYLRYAECYNNVHNPLDTSTSYADNEWHYVCGGHEGGLGNDQFLYVDGQLVSSVTQGDGLTGTDNARIGEANSANPVFDDNTAHGFQGYLDEIRVSSTNRSADWINQSYQQVANYSSIVSFGTEENFTAFTQEVSDEGTYEWNVECNDTNGYSSFALSNYNFIIDVTSPQVLFGTGTENDGTTTANNWVYVDANVIENNFENITFYLYNATNYSISTQTYTDSTRNHNFTGLTSGIYYYNITVFDKASRSGSSTTRSITLDFTPPEGNLLTPANDSYVKTTSQNLTANFTDPAGLAGAILFVLNETGYIVYTQVIALAGGVAQTIGTIYDFVSEGIYSWFYQVEDNVGNKINLTEYKITVDTTNPSINYSLGVEDSGQVLEREHIFVNVTANDAYFKNITFYLYDSTGLVFANTFTDGTREINWTSLANEVYYYNVTVFDLAGNSNSTETRNLTLDTIDPSISYTSQTKPNNALISGDTVSVYVSVTEANERNITFYLYNETNHLVWESSYTDGTRNVAWNLLDEGVYYYNVTVYDMVNRSDSTTTRKITLDNTAPQIGFGFGTEDDNSVFARDYVYFSVNLVEDNFKNVTLSLYNTTGLVSHQTFTDTTRNYNWTSLPDGEYYYNATTFDQASNYNFTSTRTIVLDNINPLIEFGANTAIDNFNKTEDWIFVNVTFTEDNFQNITYDLYNETALVNSTTLTSQVTNINFTNLPSAIYYYNVTIYDKASNYNFTSTRKIGIDYLGPSVIILKPQPKAYGYNESLPLEYIVNDAIVGEDSCWYSVHNGTDYIIQNTTVGCTGPAEFNVSGGIHTFTLHFYSNDTFNNLGYSNVTFLVSTTGPAIELIAPPDDSFYAQSTIVEFNYSAEDPDYVRSCSLWGDWGPGWHINKTDYDWVKGVFSEVTEDLETASPWNNWTNGGDGQCVFTRGTSTPSGNTGPTGGYGPSPSGTSNFLFTEATSGQNCAFDDAGTHWATLETGMLDADEYNVSLSFWYHMYGAAMGNLYIDVNDSSGWHNNTFSITGQQQTAETQNWINQIVNFGSYSGMIKVRFRAVVGTDYTSDLSIDELELTLEPRTDKYYGNFTLNLSEEGSHNWNIECNDSLGYYTFSISNYSLTFDVTDPVVDFGANTQPDNANVSQDYIFVNSSIIENNFKNITFYVYNETGSLVTSAWKNGTIRYHNFTGLSDGIYYYNMTVYDKASRSNSSSTRQIKLDITPPSGNLVSPDNNIYVNNATQNLTAFFSDINGIQEVILYIYNSTGQLIHSQLTVIGGLLSLTVGTVYEFLSDGIYQWFYQGEDTMGNQYNTTNRTIIIDTTQPFIAFIPSTLDNNSHVDQDYIYFNTTVNETNFQNITFRLFDGDGYVSPSPNTFTNSKRDINYTNLVDDVYYYNTTSFDKAGNFNTTETRTITLDTISPVINYISPTKIDHFNASQNYIYVNVSLTEVNFENITFTLYNKTDPVNSTTFTSEILEINWTNLFDGTYYYNVTTFDKANHNDTLPTREIRLDITPPLVDFGVSTAPDGSIFERDWIYIDSNIFEENFKNMSYRLYDNNSILINSTTFNSEVLNINFSASGENKTYIYDIIVYDWAGNSQATSKRNITLIDTTVPSLTLSSPENKTYPYVSGIRLNYEVYDLHLDTCWYSLDFGANTTLPNCQTISLPEFTDETGHRVDLFVNDTMSYMNQTSVNFFVNSSLIDTSTYKVIRGTTFVDGNATEEIEITDMSKSFILHTSRSSDNGPDTLQLISKFDVSNEVTFENYDSGLGAVVDWSIISGPTIKTQRGEIPFTNQANLSLSISSVNLSNSFIVVNSKLDSSDSADNVEGFFSGSFEDDSSIIFQRDNGTATGVLSYQVVSWNGTNVQSGKVIIEDGNTTSGDVSINSVNINNSFILFSHNLIGDDSVQDLFVKSNFTNSTNIRFDRRGSGGNMTITYFVVTADFFDSQISDYDHQLSSSDQFVPLNNNLTNTRRAFDVHSNDNAGTTTNFANAFTTQTIENKTHLSLQKGTGSGAGTTSWFAIEIRDTTTPIINATSPVDNYNYSTHELGPFFFIIDDESNMVNCSLYADWGSGWHLNQTIYSVNSSLENNFSAVNISTSGFYNWSIECVDIYGNYGKSQNYTLASFLPPWEPVFINITQTSNDGTGNITIFWNESLDSLKYNVYYSPNATDFEFLIQTTELNYTDSTFNGSTRRFYKVEGWNPSGTNLSTYTYGAHVYDLRHNSSGNYTVKNRNWIAFPTNFTYLENANDTLNEITGATTISRLDSTTQNIVSCSKFSCPPAISCTATACNFNITTGGGYEVSMNESGASQVNWSGVGIVYDPIQISLVYDESQTRFNKNWIAMTAGSVLIDASDLGANILGEDAITMWDNKNQVSKGYLGNVCMWFGCVPMGTDFNLTMEEGYEVSVTQDSAWTQV